MPDQPTATELINAMRSSVKSKLLPVLTGDVRKEAAMLARGLSLVAKELQDAGRTDRQIRAGWAALYPDQMAGDIDMGDLCQKIVEDIRNGRFDEDPTRAEAENAMMRHAELTLYISNPQFLVPE